MEYTEINESKTKVSNENNEEIVYKQHFDIENPSKIYNEEEKDSDSEDNEFTNEFNEFSNIKEEEEDNDGENRNIPEKDKSTPIQASITILKSIIGIGIVNLPQIFRVLGIIPSILLLFMNSAIHINTVVFLMKAKKITKRYGYAMYSKICLGRFGTIIMKLSIVLMTFGMCCVFLKVFGSILQMIIFTFLQEGKQFYCQQNFYTLIIFFLLFPLMLMNDLSSLKKFAFIGVISLFLSLFGLIYIFFYKLAQGQLPPFKVSYLYPNGSFMDILSVIPSMLDCFCFQINVFPLYTQLKPRKSKSMIQSSILGVLMAALCYLITGLFGLLIYGESINDALIIYIQKDISNYKGKNNFIAGIFFLIICGFFVSALFAMPICFLGLKKNIYTLIIFMQKIFCKYSNTSFISSENETSLSIGWKTKIAISTLVYSITLFFSLLVHKIIIVSKYTGSSCSNYISVIAPSIFVLYLSKNKFDKIFSIVTMTLGFAIFITFIISEFSR